MEETLSTLDYALRAKSIRNKPELNQRMSRNALLKDYVIEIERLKADILATREKNGIYFSEENWKQICDEKELQATELAEAKKQVAIVEKQLRSVREEYDESIALLKRRETDLKETKERLVESKDVLARTEIELGDVRIALEEETIVRKAHQHTEVVLDGVASGLNKVVKHSLQDVSDLFSKLGTIP
jgi:kinesin family member 11